MQAPVQPNLPSAEKAFAPFNSETKSKAQSDSRNLLPITADLPEELANAFRQINAIQGQQENREVGQQNPHEEEVVKGRRRKLSDFNIPVHKEDVNVNSFEDIDFGHRHFSLLHWLYPNPFLPFVHSNDSRGSHRDIYTAALNTLYNKYKKKGGHTNWSIIWQISLLARLNGYDLSLSENLSAESTFAELKLSDLPQKEGNSLFPINELIHILLQKFFSHYLTNNYLTIHPQLDQKRTVISAASNNQRRLDHELPLVPPQGLNPQTAGQKGGRSFQCETCFVEHSDDISTRISALIPFHDVYFRYQRKGTLDVTDIEEEISPSSGSPKNSLDQMLSQLQIEKGFVTQNNGKVSQINLLHLVLSNHILVSNRCKLWIFSCNS